MKNENGFYLATGNYIKNGEFGKAEDHFNKLNNFEGDDLQKIYLKTLKENAITESNQAGVGLIDVRRYNQSQFDFDIITDDIGFYLTAGVLIPFYIWTMNEFSEPKIEKNETNGVVSISGISMMEDAMDFYKPLKDWVDDYLKSNNNLVIDFELNYFNSSSAKQFIQIISKLEEDEYEGKIIWKYPNDHIIMYDRGKELEAILDVPFEFVGT